MSNFIGQSFGRYHILEQLGEGGMATVFKAYDTRLERDVAVKVIRRDAFPADQLDKILKRFEREAKSLAKLSHPNIVGILDYGEYEGSPYLVMEYLPGGTLKKNLGRPIPWKDATRILLPIARALEYAHEHHIIHRDIKPSNILMTDKGQPMLSDFGIAKILESEESYTLTGTGIGLGTPEYMAPEQWTGEAAAASDLYSLGVLFYELLTGRKPYTADTPAAILLKQNNEPLPPPRQFVPDLPEAVERTLLKMLAKKPQDRYEGMTALAGVFESLLGEASGAAPAAFTGARTAASSLPTQPEVQPVAQHPAGGASGGVKSPPPPGRPAAGGAQTASPSSRKSGWSKTVIAGAILLVFTCLCLSTGGVLYYLGTRGKGPLKILATPTSTPTTTRTPTRTPSPTPELSMEGDWELYFSWDCTSDYGSGYATFYNDGTFWVNEDSSLWGTWTMVGDYVDFTFDEYPSSHYVGTMSSDGAYMEGTMDNLDGMSGCWYAYYGIAPATAEASLIGEWTLYWSWDCTGDYGNGLITYYDDSSFYLESGSYVGTWFTSGDYVEFQITEYPSSTYVGTLDSSGTYMEGTMDNLDGMTGCWYAYYGSSPAAPADASLTGEWTVYFSWDCTGDYSNVLFTFYDDYSFYTDPYTGSWYVSGTYVEFTFDEAPFSYYTGTLDGSGTYMDGTMSNSDGGSGCWYAIR